MSDFTHIKRYIVRREAAAKGTIANFQLELSKHSLEAFRWGDEAALAAARLQVCREISKAIENEVSLRDLVDTIQERLVSKANFPTRSTSPLSNLCGQCETQVWAEVREVIRMDELDAADKK